MDRNEIFDKLKEIFLETDDSKKSEIENSTEDTRLVEDLGFSSVGMLYTVIEIEEKFNVQFDDVDANAFKTVGSVIDYIEKKLK